MSRSDEANRRSFRGSSVTVHSDGWEQRQWSSRFLHRFGDAASHSFAGMAAALAVILWVALGWDEHFPQWWQTTLYSVTGSITFVMVFVIQHTQARQTMATQRKLDELIRSSHSADDALIAVEEAPDEHLQALAGKNVAARDQVLGQR